MTMGSPVAGSSVSRRSTST